MNKSISVLFLALMLSIPALAREELLRLFLKENSSIFQARSAAQEAQLQYDAVTAAKSWGLSLSSSYYKNELDGTVMQMANRSHELTLAKEFFWGGHLTFSSGYGKVDTFANAFIPADQSNYEFTQTIGYTQDLGSNFFGMDDRIDLRIATKSAQMSEAESQLSIESSLLSFNALLVQAMLNKTLLKLEEEALARAIKREKMIKRRVRDGLLEKVDLHQATMAVLMRREGIKSAKISFDRDLSSIIAEVHQSIQPERITVLKSKNTKQLPQGGWESSIEKKHLQKRVELLEESLAKIKYSFVPELKLSTMYRTNSYEETGSEALNKGNLSGDKGEISVGVSLSMPVWFGPQRVEKQRANIQLKSAQITYEQRKKSFGHEVNLAKKQISYLDDNIRSSEERIRLAQKVLKEYNKLYNFGRADLDQVIRAEEDLITTQKGAVTYLAQYDGMKASLAFMLGSLQKYLLEER